MKIKKSVLLTILCAVFIICLFSGCSNSQKLAADITEDTMLIAYTQENSPFLYKNENGEFEGFDAEIINEIFDSVKGEYKNYTFIQVPDDYKLNEDVCYTDENGKEYKAKIMCGGTRKNTGTANQDVNWSVNILENNIVTVVSAGSTIINADIPSDTTAGVTSAAAMEALNRNAAYKSNFETIKEYASISDSLAALDNGEIDAVITETFDFCKTDGSEKYTVLPGVLDKIEYAYQFAKNDDLSWSFNEAIREMQSADYSDGDTLTPLVEKHFGYKDACVFEYKTDGDK